MGINIGNKLMLVPTDQGLLHSAIQLSADEHVQYLWVNWRDAMDKVFSWTNVEAIKKLAEIHQLKL
jgi:hypothetical protein